MLLEEQVLWQLTYTAISPIHMHSRWPVPLLPLSQRICYTAYGALPYAAQNHNPAGPEGSGPNAVVMGSPEAPVHGEVSCRLKSVALVA